MNNRPIASSIKYVVLHNPLLTIGVILSIIGSVAFSVIPPLVLERVVYMITEEGRITLAVAFIYLAFVALGGVFESFRGAFLTALGQKISTRIRSLMMKKMTRISADYFSREEAGKTLSKITNDVDAIDTLFKSGVISMVVDLFKIIVIFAIVFTKSTGLGIMLVAFSPLTFGISLVFKKRMHSAQMDNRRAIARINNHIPETITNIRTVHNLKKEEYMKKRFRKYVDESYSAFKKTYFYEATYTPIICEISTIIIALLMTFSAISGTAQTFFGMGVGTAVAVISYVTKVFTPIENLGMEIQNIQSAIAGVGRVCDFFAEKEKPSQSVYAMDGENEYAVKFEGVTFAYDDNVVLNNLSLAIKKGESVAFTGRTGAGKSTIFKLILGLYSPKEGKVTVNGFPADEICDNIKRKMVGYVEQSAGIVSGTVRDNITLGDGEISEKEIETALDTVGLREAIASFPKGLDEKCSESMFSKGQLQLLSIARAIVKNPPLLLLDEITANLDSETEKAVTVALKEASKNRTVINVSHRLGDIREDTRIIDITKIQKVR